MALIKQMGTDYGVSINYHKIGTINISYHTQKCNIEVLSFASKDARQEGRKPIGMYTYQFNGDDFDFDPDSALLPALYEKVKDAEEFTNATDDL